MNRFNIKFFLLPVLCLLFQNVGAQTISTFEYWFNSGFTSRQQISTPAGTTANITQAIESNSLDDGLHLINMRAKDSKGKWSIVHSQSFYKNKALLSDGGIVAYEYWFDDNHTNKKYQTSTTSKNFILIDEVDLSAIESGLHSFNIRSMDNLNRWSIVHTQTFFKNKVIPTDGGVVAYEYWVDNEYDKKVKEATTSSKEYILVDGINLSTIESGLHTFNIRSMDNLDRWSAVHTQTFYKNAQLPEGGNNIDAYCYWFDKNAHHSELVLLETAVNPFELNVSLNVPDSLEMGEHLFNIRFRDKTGRWSITEVDTFTKVQAAPRINIEGIVRRSDNNVPVTSGKVYLYDVTDFGMYDIIDVAEISEAGSYSFLRRQPDSYLIRAVSDDVQSSLPTYFGNVGLWTGAAIVEANDEGIITKDISLIILSETSESATIKGVVNFESTEQSDRAVIILIQNSLPVAATYGNGAGEYLFENVAVGDYQVIIDVAGVFMLETYDISITEDFQTKDNINYDVKNDGIKKTPATGLIEHSIDKLMVYPNPFENQLILVPDNIRGKFSARLIDMGGKTTWMEDIDIQSGEVEMTIPTLPKGIYLLRLSGENKQFQIKVQKK